MVAGPTHRPRLRRLLGLSLAGALLAVAAVVLTVVLGAVSATAGQGGLLLHVAGDPSGWTGSPSRPLLDMSELAPGDSVSGQVGIRNTSGVAALLALTATGVRDDKRCVQGAPGSSGACGQGKGHLDRWLTFTVRRAGQSTPLWNGHITDLEAPATLVPNLAAGAETDLRMTASLAADAPDSVQEDLVTFGLRWTLTQQAALAGGAHKLVGAGSTDTGSGLARSGLAFTGGELLPASVLGVGLLAAGGLIVLTVRDRRRRQA